MFQFRRFPTHAYLIQRALTGSSPAGLPHSEIPGSMDICSSPRLIAACHVLHRLLMPRHSPCALFSLTSSAQSPLAPFPPPAKTSLAPLRLLFLADPLRWAPLGEFTWFSRIMQAIPTRDFFLWLIAFYPSPFGVVPQLNFSFFQISPKDLSVALLYSFFFFLCSVFKVRTP